MEAELVRELPEGDKWQYEPKWDGFRGLLENGTGELRLWSRNARPLLRYFPELRQLEKLLPPLSALDGEIVIERDGVLDFDAMQTRLHPAESRVNKLSAEIPARFIAFDVLEGRPPIGERRAPVLDPVPDEHVEGDEARRDLRGQLAHPALRRVQARLHRVEVEDAVTSDHDLAVDRGARRQDVAERRQLREVAQERPRVPRPEPQIAGRVLEQAAKPVPLRLVLPLVPLRELADELGLHGWERDDRVEVGGTLDRLAATAASAGHAPTLDD